MFTKTLQIVKPGGIIQIKNPLLTDSKRAEIAEAFSKVMQESSRKPLLLFNDGGVDFKVTNLGKNKKQRRATFVAVPDSTGRYFVFGKAEWNPDFKLPFTRKEGIKIAERNAIKRPIALMDTEALHGENKENVGKVVLKNLYDFCQAYQYGGKAFRAHLKTVWAPKEIIETLKF